MNVLPIIIDRFAKLIIGGVPFESMKRIATDANNSLLTGSEKREAVRREFCTLSYDLAEFLINLGLELAVTYLKNKEANDHH